MHGFKIFILCLIFVIGLIANSTFFIVDEAHQAIVVQLGKVTQKISDSGLHAKIPFIQTVFFLDKRIIDMSSDSSEVIAADQKRFIVDSYAKYRIVDPIKFYQTVRNESGLENRLGSIIESYLREKIGTVSLINLLNEARSEVMSLIQNGVSKEAEKFGVEIIDVRIKKADLPEENSSAIFRRMQTDREKEAKEIRAEGEEVAQEIRANANKQKSVIISNAVKENKIIRGHGEARAAEIYNEASSLDEKFFEFYRSMQAYRKAFTDSNTKVILSPNNNFMNLFNKESKK